MKRAELNTIISAAFLNTKAKFKNNLIEYKCLCCNKNYQKKFDENLK